VARTVVVYRATPVATAMHACNSTAAVAAPP